ncbi:hypothetical protein BDA96_08G169700 [Sorghum bicolor]|uniref:Uncharacterized protein n=1 Tax=Sorghum bicolor TaxID=4558 RepID=A0A921QGC4_SORBI|nr:hypothetical protein BDA96_08G169700 [Sorghum bicolor]
MRLEKICSICPMFPFFDLLAGPQWDPVLRSFCLLYRNGNSVLRICIVLGLLLSSGSSRNIFG